MYVNGYDDSECEMLLNNIRRKGALSLLVIDPSHQLKSDYKAGASSIVRE